MFYHVIIETTEKDKKKEFITHVAKNIEDKSILMSQYVVPYINNRKFIVNGYNVESKNIRRFQVKSSEENASKLVERAYDELRGSGVIVIYTEERVIDGERTKDITQEILDEANELKKGNETKQKEIVYYQKTDAELKIIAERFHLVARQIRERHNGRDTLNINDEYDVQDLFHALLRLHYDDIRKEEWVPSYAGGSSRTDFYLPEINTLVEIKKTRQGLGSKEIGGQLIIDIAQYQRHPGCKKIFCFVYDPDGRISNPSGIANDLTRTEGYIQIEVIIAPKGY